MNPYNQLILRITKAQDQAKELIQESLVFEEARQREKKARREGVAENEIEKADGARMIELCSLAPGEKPFFLMGDRNLEDYGHLGTTFKLQILEHILVELLAHLSHRASPVEEQPLRSWKAQNP